MMKPSVVFFGSGPVALTSLQLLKTAFRYEAIITKQSTLTEMQLAFPTTPIFAANARAELDILCISQYFKSSLGLLIDYGVIVSKQTIKMFPFGIVNSHFSLLPEWRGADPISFAILSGQSTTGVSIMLLAPGLDDGPLLAQQRTDIPLDCTTPILTDMLVKLSAEMLPAAIAAYLDGTLRPREQREASLLGTNSIPTYSHKLSRNNGQLDWRKSASVLEREIRAYQPWPRSRTMLAGREVIIAAASVADISGTPGKILVDKKQLFVCCGEQALEIVRLQPAGKKIMDTSAFLAGYGSLLLHNIQSPYST